MGLGGVDPPPEEIHPEVAEDVHEGEDDRGLAQEGGDQEVFEYLRREEGGREEGGRVKKRWSCG